MIGTATPMGERLQLARSDFWKLAPMGWLSESVSCIIYVNWLLTNSHIKVIDMYLQLVRRDMPPHNTRNTFVFPSLWMTKGLTPEGARTVAQTYVSPLSLHPFQYDSIVIPTFLLGDHWCLTFVDLEAKKLTLYDSYRSHGRDGVAAFRTVCVLSV
jgi:Ulp1 family protease